MDNADRAQEQMERAMDQYRQPATNHHTTAFCVDCGENIEQARQLHGFQTCIDCQRERER